MIHIYTAAHKRPDFIELQLRSFRKFLQEDFEFIVFNNAAFDTNKDNYGKIRDACTQLNLRVIDVLKDPRIVDACQAQESALPIFQTDGTYSHACIACAYPLCWAWKTHISRDTTPICILESDMFLVRPIKFTDYLRDHDLVYVAMMAAHAGQSSPLYMHSGMVLADPSHLPEPETMDWYCGRARGVPVDVGGQTYKYLEAHPELRHLHIGAAHIEDEPGFPAVNYDQYSLDGVQTILHYRCGSNWNAKSDEYHQKKTKWLLEKLT